MRQWLTEALEKQKNNDGALFKVCQIVLDCRFLKLWRDREQETVQGNRDVVERAVEKYNKRLDRYKELINSGKYKRN